MKVNRKTKQQLKIIVVLWIPIWVMSQYIIEWPPLWLFMSRTMLKPYILWSFFVTESCLHLLCFSSVFESIRPEKCVECISFLAKMSILCVVHMQCHSLCESIATHFCTLQLPLPDQRHKTNLTGMCISSSSAYSHTCMSILMRAHNTNEIETHLNIA